MKNNKYSVFIKCRLWKAINVENINKITHH